MSQTHMLRYWLDGQASLPPLAEDLTASLVPKALTLVDVRVMPLVGLPLGSIEARQNSISESAACGQVPSASGLVRRKSWLSTSICDWIWAAEMFSALVL